MYEKKDGGVIDRVQHNNIIYKGRQMNKLIMTDFQKIHCIRPNIEYDDTFPEWDITWK